MSGISGSFQMAGGLSMRLPRPSDEAFLLDMFKGARPWIDWTSHDTDFVRHLYEEQLRITRAGMGSVYPEHLEFIVEKTGQSVAHLVVDLGYSEWRLSQLEVHPLARSKGIGSDIVRSLQAAAGNSSMPLTVAVPMILPRTLAFYARLGFLKVGEQAPMIGLAWFPPNMPRPATQPLMQA